MKKIRSCELNMDTGCVELRFTDGGRISIDCTDMENEVADNRFQRSELDYLIYNDPLAYADLILNGDVDDLLKEYVALYGKATWSMSTYSANVGLVEHYISPIIGTMKISEINTRVMEKYYQQLLKTKPVEPTVGKKKNEFLTPHTVRSIHKLLHSCFEQAVKWELMEKNPCDYASLPKAEYKKRDIWTAETLFHAMELCEDERLKLCLNLAFACSLRMGELLGLTWDCVEISEEAISYIQVNKELQRVNRNTLNTLDSKM